MPQTRFESVRKNHETQMQTVAGVSFYGRILDIPDTSRVSTFISVRRYLKTSTTCSIQPRDVIVAGEEQYIVGDHGTGFPSGFTKGIYKHYKIYQVDIQCQWEKTSKVQDPVTGVWRTVRTLQTELAYLSFEIIPNQEDTAIGTPVQAVRAVTNVPAQRDDILNGMVVTKVDESMGLSILEMREF